MIIRQINEDEYLTFFEQSPHRQVFQRLEWIRSIANSYPVRWQLLGGFDNKTLVIAFPVYIRKSYGILQFAGSPLPQIATPIPTVVIKDNTINTSELIKAIRIWLKKEHISYFQMSTTMAIESSLKGLGVEYEIVDNLELPIEKPIEELWKDIKKKRKSLIKIAVRSGIKIHWLHRKNVLEEYQRLLHSTYDDYQKLKPNFREQLYINIHNNLHNNGLKLIGATYKGRIVSILWIFHDNEKCYFWDGASDRETVNKIDTNRLLHWEVIKWAKRKGLKIYDLVGRSEKSGRAGLRPGIAQFKKTLGAVRVDYLKVILCPAWFKIGLSFYRKLLAIKNKPKMDKGPQDER